MAGADVLLLLSDVDGLYTADPRRDPGAERLPWVEAVTPRSRRWPAVPAPRIPAAAWRPS
jgi:glutamate 5-kinase